MKNCLVSICLLKSFSFVYRCFIKNYLCLRGVLKSSIFSVVFLKSSPCL